MDERHLLLLGVLMAQSQHAYRINDFIETNLGRVSNMKRATAYALLERLEKRGLVRMEVQTVGNHPPRKVYSITEAGKQAFLDLLQALLAASRKRLRRRTSPSCSSTTCRASGPRSSFAGGWTISGSRSADWQRPRATLSRRASTTPYSAKSPFCRPSAIGWSRCWAR